VKKKIALLLALGLWGAGCSSEPVAPSSVPEPDPATGTAEYWLAKPATSSAASANYDQLWGASEAVARADFYSLDREDYREGLLTTRPLVSKQIWEFWRNDAGDAYEADQDSVQTIRRTILFEFDRQPSGCKVTPKVLIERLAQPNRRITSSGEYKKFFNVPGRKTDVDNPTDDYWFSVGRDYAMEAELAAAIQQKLGAQ
jgi:hypothetical protein